MSISPLPMTASEKVFMMKQDDSAERTHLRAFAGFHTTSETDVHLEQNSTSDEMKRLQISPVLYEFPEVFYLFQQLSVLYHLLLF